MPPPAKVVDWVKQHYPRPHVDPEWLNDCCEWLTHDQGISPENAFPQFIDAFKSQLLQSDLKDSMVHGTGLEPGINAATRALRGSPVLVQIVAITEIGTSAFQLEQTRAARAERMKAGEGNVEGEEEGDVEVEGEGPMPKYPRGTLRFRLSDGATIVDAMEYRHLPGLTLGSIPLGFKMQLKGTRFQNGMAFLEPATVDLLGEKTSDLDEHRELDFKRGLRVRLGRPLSPEPPANASLALHSLEAEARSPLRDISPPPAPEYPQHDDDINMEPRRRLPVGSTLATIRPSTVDDKNVRPIHNLPTRQITNSASQNSKASTSSSYFSSAVPGSSRSTTTTREERDRAIAMALQSLEQGPTTRQLSLTISSQAPADTDNDSFDFNLLDEFENDENTAPPPPPASSSKGKARESSLQPPLTLTSKAAPTNAAVIDNRSSPDYFMDDDELDPAILEKLDEMEKSIFSANIVPAVSRPGGITVPVTPANSLPNNVRTGSSAPKLPSDVIEIEDSDSDEGMLQATDKENEPVQARSVRRRVDRRVETVASSRRNQRQGTRASARTDSPDVISLSDSD